MQKRLSLLIAFQKQKTDTVAAMAGDTDNLEPDAEPPG